MVNQLLFATKTETVIDPARNLDSIDDDMVTIFPNLHPLLRIANFPYVPIRHSQFDIRNFVAHGLSTNRIHLVYGLLFSCS